MQQYSLKPIKILHLKAPYVNADAFLVGTLYNYTSETQKCLYGDV